MEFHLFNYKYWKLVTTKETEKYNWNIEEKEEHPAIIKAI